MKRRDFFTAAAGVGTGAVLGAAPGPAMAAQTRTAEKRSQVYQCVKCGTIVEILVPGHPMLAHCGEPMELLTEQTADWKIEKHVPVIEKVDGGYKITVGSTPHPMTEAHFIQWIELLADGIVYRKYLKPGDKPEAAFSIEAAEVSAREHCNLHGLWKG
jgi:superoxide reductase